jgi:hypothetical protein
MARIEAQTTARIARNVINVPIEMRCRFMPALSAVPAIERNNPIGKAP